MKKLIACLRGIKVEYTKTHPITKAAVGTLLTLSILAMIALAWTGQNLRADIEAMRQEATRLEAENAELKRKTDNPDAVDVVEDVAQDELDMVNPDTIIIIPNP